MDTDVAIIGGGLAGLALAEHLHRVGRDVQLFEARQRLGGRIDALNDGAAFDLGPSWFWPGQHRMAQLVARLGLGVFEQYAKGVGVYENVAGALMRAPGLVSMAGSLRVTGGMTALIAALARHLPADRIQTGQRVIGIGKGSVTLEQGQIRARHIVLALPPRLAAGLRFDTALPPGAVAAMTAIPTWMAGQAKVVATYDTAFWRLAGLSGDAASQRGPLGEIHDASAASGQPAALFGFVATPPGQRDNALCAAALAQLVRMFGPQAATPRQVVLRDWAADPLTATGADQTPLPGHPAYGLPRVPGNLWDGTLHLGGSETAAEFGGYLEGALCAAETVAARLLATPAR